MGRVYHVVCLVLLFLLMGLAQGPALAWELELAGEYAYEYRYVTQSGVGGFFGPHDQNTLYAGGTPQETAANQNAYVGHQIGSPIVTGLDASTLIQDFDVDVEIRLNKAVRFRGHYHLGAYGDPDASDYRVDSAPGTNIAMSDGQWTLWWLTAQTPWGIIVTGKRPSAWGMGLHWNGDGGDRAGEGTTLVSNYGPFRFGVGFRPARPGNFDSTQYENYEDDKTTLRNWNICTFVTYRTGPADIGFRNAYVYWHEGPEGDGNVPHNTYTRDRWMRAMAAYLKYQNGRVFFNTEVVGRFHRFTWQGVPGAPDFNDGRGSRFAPQYINHVRYAVETGFFAGPAKLSLFHAHLPGPDRRNGVLIRDQPYWNSRSASGIFLPYSYLLGFCYGSGLGDGSNFTGQTNNWGGGFDDNGDGTFNAASVIACRLDYALAANLNLYGTFMWAERAGHGYGWGFIEPGGDDGANESSPIQFNDEGRRTRRWNALGGSIASATNRNNQAVQIPNIPDTALGWEVTAGFDWQLLENFGLGLRTAYWQPGKWFNYACVDKSLAPGDLTASPWGVNPNRSIDPIVSTTATLIADF